MDTLNGLRWIKDNNCTHANSFIKTNIIKQFEAGGL